MLDSMALISYSRALTKVETSRSPFLFRALSEVWASIFLAFEVLTRLAARLKDDWLFESDGCFRLAEAFEAIEHIRSRSYILFPSLRMLLRRKIITNESILFSLRGRMDFPNIRAII